MHWTPMVDGAHGVLAGAGGWFAVFARTAAPAFARTVASMAVAAIWQGAAIALVLGLCLRLTSRVSSGIGAAQRFALWAAAFAVVAGLPFLPWLAWHSAGAIASNARLGTAGPLGAAGPRAWFAFDDRWALAIAAVWLAASLVRAAGLAMHALRLRRIWKAATPVAADARLNSLLRLSRSEEKHPSVAKAAWIHQWIHQRVTARVNSRPIKTGLWQQAICKMLVGIGGRPVELCTTRELDRPCVIGFFAPRILIPDWLFERLTPGELEQVVLHEAEHLRRGDDWTNLLQKLALVLFPLNPALKWIEGRLCREREMACDEGVVRRTQAPRAYAACLTNMAERRLELRLGLRLERQGAHALSLGAFERRPELVRRVYSILARKQAIHPVAAGALVAMAGCGLLIASVELARCPQMVAFVPAARTVTLEKQTIAAIEQGDGDRVFVQPAAVRGDSGLRVVRTSAILPARQRDAVLKGNAPLSSHATRRAVSSPVGREDVALREEPSIDRDGHEAAPREIPLRSETSSAETSSAETSSVDTEIHGQPEYVVLTAWEEVRTSLRNVGMISDYDADASAQPQSVDGAKQLDGQPTVQITVTRLIFAFYSNSAKPASHAAGTKPAHAEDSGQLPAPQPQSGWLVLQL